MALAVDGGKLVNKGSALGTGQACCCNADVPCTYTVRVEGIGDPGANIGFNYCGCCGEYSGDAEKWIEAINSGAAAVVAELRNRGFTVAYYGCVDDLSQTTLEDYVTCDGAEEPCDAEVSADPLACSICVHCDGTLVEDLELGELPVTSNIDVAREECNSQFPIEGEVAVDFNATDSVLLSFRCEPNEFP